MTLSADILGLFAAREAAPVDVPILQPADPFLDMAGEDLRRRIFLTESETGQQLCLRPEFTIPVCLDHIATQSGTPRRYAYLGEVFRQRRGAAPEFMQAGIEDLGDPEIAAADARLVTDAHAIIVSVLPRARPRITLGDQGVFEAVLAALGLPRGWQKRLIRAFGEASKLEAALRDLADPPRNGGLSGEAALLVASGEREALTAHVAAGMEEAGLPTTAGRSAAEIAGRLIEKAELRSVRLAPEALGSLRRFLALKVPLAEAPGALAGFAQDAGLAMGPALARFDDRAQAIARQGLDAAVLYDAAFGRPLDYYTGLVFEIAGPGEADRPLAGGGRYDRLLTMLGAKTPIPGVGFSLWLDRIEALRGEGR
jgi:ATP phosphoribosyltransferase regulatory subunit